MNTAVISIGSNINPKFYIPKAFIELEKYGEIIKKATLQKTKPIDVLQKQDDFINTGCLVRTLHAYQDLILCLKKIEIALDRPANHDSMAPRTIDIDIIIWNKKVVDKDVYKRTFLQNIITELISDWDY